MILSNNQVAKPAKPATPASQPSQPASQASQSSSPETHDHFHIISCLEDGRASRGHCPFFIHFHAFSIYFYAVVMFMHFLLFFFHVSFILIHFQNILSSFANAKCYLCFVFLMIKCELSCFIDRVSCYLSFHKLFAISSGIRGFTCYRLFVYVICYFICYLIFSYFHQLFSNKLFYSISYVTYFSRKISN